MKPRYLAQLVLLDQRHGGHQVSSTRRFKTKQRATRWLQARLPPVICTGQTYHRDLGRAGWGAVLDRKTGREVAAVEPEVHLVASVSELGVTP